MRCFLAGLLVVGLSTGLMAGCAPGDSCTVIDNGDGTATIVCEDGTMVTVTNGEDGMSGGDGMPGTDGMPGLPCTVVDNADGTKTITCDDGTTVTVVDGVPGDRGRSALVAAAGLELEVMDITIDAARVPTVTLRMTDAEGAPLDREGVYTPGAVSGSFTIAYLEVDAAGVVGQYVNYNVSAVTSAISGMTADQPRSEGGGVWAEVGTGDGVYTYTFENALPEGYDVTATHTIGIYSTRTVEGVRYVANAVPNFRPDGMPVTATRELVTTATCNSCHNDLAMHGGSRREVGLCVTCHTAGMADPDTGNSIDFPVMVHRIHSGEHLPSVIAGTPYQIIGYRDSVHDYSTVAFPQSTSNCTTCHRDAAMADRWSTVVTVEVCNSCHDEISYDSPVPAGMTAHMGGPLPIVADCVSCHTPSGGALSIANLHLTTFRDPSAPDLVITISNVTNTGPTETPQVSFRVLLNGVGQDILASPLDRIRMTLAGPTTGYLGYKQYSPTTEGVLVVVDGAAGDHRYTFPETMSAAAASIGVAAEGSFAVGIEARVRPGGSPNPRFAALAPVEYFAVTDPVTVPRRHVVENARCNSCHDDLRMHGGGRRGTEYCVMCHNANNDDVARRPAPAAGATDVTQSVRFGRMIHRIHTGEEGSSPVVIYGYGSSAHDFSELRFPGDRRDCETCHDGATYQLPLADSVPPTRTQVIDDTGAVIDQLFTPPTSSMCTSCHDSAAAVAHAEVMTSALGGESCAVCHGPGRGFALDLVHARPEFL